MTGLKNLILLFISISVTAVSHAALPYPWFVSISAGPEWGMTPGAQTLTLAPDIVKTYVPSTLTQAIAEGEVYLGLRRALRNNIDGQLGLAFMATSHATLPGYILDDGLSQFNNYSYQYKLQHDHVAVKGKLLWQTQKYLMPWVAASLGVGWNKAYGFTNTPLISQAVVMPNFNSNTTTAFTYTLGVGVQHALANNLQIGLGYEFADWGQNQLNPAFAQTLGNGLNLSYFYTNGLMFNVTYLG